MWGSSRGASHQDEAQAAADAIAAECFRAFDKRSDVSWRIPYKVFHDGGVRDPNSSGGHFAWFAATSHKPQNE